METTDSQAALTTDSIEHGEEGDQYEKAIDKAGGFG